MSTARLTGTRTRSPERPDRFACALTLKTGAPNTAAANTTDAIKADIFFIIITSESPCPLLNKDASKRQARPVFRVLFDATSVWIVGLPARPSGGGAGVCLKG